MNLHGFDRFNIELVEEVDLDIASLEEREKYWINYFNSRNDKIGYNISPGGFGGPLFTGHKHNEDSKLKISNKSKGRSQDQIFIKKRSYVRARIMQSLDDAKIYSILELPKGYFYPQTIFQYRIYKTNNKFYACLESPHNRLPQLTAQECSQMKQDLIRLIEERKTLTLNSLHDGHTAISQQKREQASKKLQATKQQQHNEACEALLIKYDINRDEYITNYNKYKNSCPNKHLQLIYNIERYSMVRKLNNYLGLNGGGSGHKYGKVIIEENN